MGLPRAILQEMMGLATLLAGGPASEVTTAFKEAFFRYNTSVAPLVSHYND